MTMTRGITCCQVPPCHRLGTVFAFRVASSTSAELVLRTPQA